MTFSLVLSFNIVIFNLKLCDFDARVPSYQFALEFVLRNLSKTLVIALVLRECTFSLNFDLPRLFLDWIGAYFWWNLIYNRFPISVLFLVAQRVFNRDVSWNGRFSASFRGLSSCNSTSALFPAKMNDLEQLRTRSVKWTLADDSKVSLFHYLFDVLWFVTQESYCLCSVLWLNGQHLLNS